MKSKLIANDIIAAYNRYVKGECTYDRALEDISNIIEKFADERPFVKNIPSKDLKKVFKEIVNNASPDVDKTYIMNVKLHRNEYQTILWMFDCLLGK